jgi:plastocyanin
MRLAHPHTRVANATARGMPLVVALIIAGCSSSSPQALSSRDASGSLNAAQDGAALDASLDDSAHREASGVLPDDAAAAVVDSSFAEAGLACQAAFAGCASFVDATAADADRTVHFQDYSYDPKCLMVRAGQTVTFSGDFIRHPLTPSCGPELLLEFRDTTTAASFEMDAVGVYGYYCLDHGDPQGDTMSGAIEVVP